MALFGANASGKTNILKAFGALQQLLHEGGHLSEVYQPNLLNPKFSDSAFALEFIIGDDRLEYRIAHNVTEIKEESFLKNGKPSHSSTASASPISGFIPT